MGFHVVPTATTAVSANLIFRHCVTLHGAMTVHKAQGSTYATDVLVDLAGCFASGHTYVAMSRVQSAAQLHFVRHSRAEFRQIFRARGVDLKIVQVLHAMRHMRPAHASLAALRAAP